MPSKTCRNSPYLGYDGAFTPVYMVGHPLVADSIDEPPFVVADI